MPFLWEQSFNKNSNGIFLSYLSCRRETEKRTAPCSVDFSLFYIFSHKVNSCLQRLAYRVPFWLLESFCGLGAPPPSFDTLLAV